MNVAFSFAQELLRKERSGFRQKDPARKGRALTPSKRLKLPALIKASLRNQIGLFLLGNDIHGRVIVFEAFRMLSLPGIAPRGSKKTKELKMKEVKKKSAGIWQSVFPVGASGREARRTTLHSRTLTAGLLFLGLMAIARPAAAACSNASLTGTYGIAWGWPQEMY